MLSVRSPARRRLVLAVGALFVVAVVVVTVVVVRQVAGPPVDPVAQDEQGPVLVVPGYGGSTDSVEPLVAALEQDGRDATVVELAGDGTGDLRTQAQVLADAAEAAVARTGAESVDVVGYSAGGVIARLWVRDFGGASVARRVVTLGSPHHGTDVAGIAGDITPDSCPTGCQQLSPNNELIRRLNAGDETPVGPVFVSVWTVFDEVVTPPETSRLDGALNLTVQSVCSGSQVQHGGLPEEPAVAAVLNSTLGAAAPAAPDGCPT